MRSEGVPAVMPWVIGTAKSWGMGHAHHGYKRRRKPVHSWRWTWVTPIGLVLAGFATSFVAIPRLVGEDKKSGGLVWWTSTASDLLENLLENFLNHRRSSSMRLSHSDSAS